MAPAYANLFMSTLETSFLHDYPIKHLLWRRFIDNILVVWPGTPDSFHQLMRDVNSFHKFTYNVSTSDVTFLDLTLYKGDRFQQTGKLDIRPHFKAINRFQYFHFNLSHPRSTFRGIMMGELIRILRASSDRKTFEENKLLLSNCFLR